MRSIFCDRLLHKKVDFYYYTKNQMGLFQLAKMERLFLTVCKVVFVSACKMLFQLLVTVPNVTDMADYSWLFTCTDMPLYYNCGW